MSNNSKFILSDIGLKRFWSKVDVTSPDKCWGWTASKNTGGYGCFSDQYRKMMSHRVSYQLKTGLWLSPSRLVCHKCDNPPCCNPDHLFEGSSQDNKLDCVKKNRHAKNNVRPQVGTKNGRAILSEDDIREIRLMLSNKCTRPQIASRFGISESHVGDIKYRQWKHVV